ncbi:MAG: type II toxin-antitoxin system VapC family toxin [Deltaproteobacteria bacterium]|nr:type II toxin-antitoxin system VapC family toxin [Deltaproteobacteria bacterium]
MDNNDQVIYWDASAILSALFKDSHSHIATKWAEKDAAHFLSTLAYSEVCAVISRMRKENILSDILIKSSFEVFDQGPWRRITISPEWEITRDLSQKWSLRGADLWHLATSKSLQKDFPELFMLTFDSRLETAAKGEGLISLTGFRPSPE